MFYCFLVPLLSFFPEFFQELSVSHGIYQNHPLGLEVIFQFGELLVSSFNPHHERLQVAFSVDKRQYLFFLRTEPNALVLHFQVVNEVLLLQHEILSLGKLL